MSACSLPHHENAGQWNVNDIWFSIVGNLSCELLHTVINGVLAAFISKTYVVQSLPPSQNEHQQSVNDIWLCILGNLHGNVRH